MTEKETSELHNIKATPKPVLVSHYLPLVRAIASKIKRGLPSSIDLDELVQYGMIGLLEAASRFDDNQHVAFTTFAYYRIRGAIYDGLRNMGWLGRTEYARQKYEAQANEYLAEEELQLAGQLNNMSAAEASQKLTAIVNNLATIFITSMDSQNGWQIQDNSQEAPDEQLTSRETITLLRKALQALTPEERQLIELYYYHDKSMQEIGDFIGKSKSWTSRLHGRIIEKLHRILQRMEL